MTKRFLFFFNCNERLGLITESREATFYFFLYLPPLDKFLFNFASVIFKFFRIHTSAGLPGINV